MDWGFSSVQHQDAVRREWLTGWLSDPFKCRVPKKSRGHLMRGQLGANEYVKVTRNKHLSAEPCDLHVSWRLYPMKNVWRVAYFRNPKGNKRYHTVLYCMGGFFKLPQQSLWSSGCTWSSRTGRTNNNTLKEKSGTTDKSPCPSRDPNDRVMIGMTKCHLTF